jgi:hypothetical protein
MKNGILAQGDWLSLSTEPSKSGLFSPYFYPGYFKQSKLVLFYSFLMFPDFFGWEMIKTIEKTYTQRTIA